MHLWEREKIKKQLLKIPSLPLGFWLLPLSSARVKRMVYWSLEIGGCAHAGASHKIMKVDVNIATYFYTGAITHLKASWWNVSWREKQREKDADQKKKKCHHFKSLTRCPLSIAAGVHMVMWPREWSWVSPPLLRGFARRHRFSVPPKSRLGSPSVDLTQNLRDLGVELKCWAYWCESAPSG